MSYFRDYYKQAKKLYEFGIYVPTENYTLRYVCLIAKKWLQGNSLKEIIAEQILWDADHSEKKPSINTSVRSIIKVINNDIRFRFSNALRCYYDLLTNVLANKGLQNQSVKLHYFIEVGCCDERMINLINMGLTRETAKEIEDKLHGDHNPISFADLLRLYNEGKLDTLHPVTKKELLYLLNRTTR
ncbi:hypothetical protein ABK905_22345 [Acerihabitans sp. KWT182]|uniref:Uncharacterized protein n=1 Tax=Acerihabitans sp. KWT182 TaxID=3157919 RepID=A0AAU7Q891_9GAMM